MFKKEYDFIALNYDMADAQLQMETWRHAFHSVCSQVNVLLAAAFETNFIQLM